MQTKYTKIPRTPDNKKPRERRSGGKPTAKHRANDSIQPIIQLNASNTTRNSTLTALYTAK
ncbi:hypothetical protein G1C94_0822 [Bifidobacterium sp. DSM 109963]|uniref:Uncharacterized protein n=1 Tax=Bifidobacterium panos TaxID=2675321 RepID=A0ABX1SXW5_9BIFI|nr:hypothetical protein [Bifidobacterium sp. DSM 109963]